MPGEYRAADVVLLCAGLAALAFLQAEHLLALTMVLLDLPADSARIFYGDGRTLRQVVGGDLFRAVGRRNPEQFHLVVHRETMYFHKLAAQHFVAEPIQLGNRPVGVFALAVIHLSVGFQWAVKQFAGLVDVHH